MAKRWEWKEWERFDPELFREQLKRKNGADDHLEVEMKEKMLNKARKALTKAEEQYNKAIAADRRNPGSADWALVDCAYLDAERHWMDRSWSFEREGEHWERKLVLIG